MKKKIISISCFIIIAYILWFFGYPKYIQKFNHEKTVINGLSKVIYAKKIEEVFGDSDHLIWGNGTKYIWQTHVFFGGQCELSMKMEVEIDFKNNDIIKTIGEPETILFVIEEISFDKDGFPSGSSFLKQRKITKEELDLLLSNNGDLTKINFQLEYRNVKNFEKFIYSVRRGRPKGRLIYKD